MTLSMLERSYELIMGCLVRARTIGGTTRPRVTYIRGIESIEGIRGYRRIHEGIRGYTRVYEGYEGIRGYKRVTRVCSEPCTLE